MKMLKATEVADRLSVSKATLYRMIARGAFPDGVKLSPRRVGWVEADVDAWIEKQKGAA